MFGYDLFGHAMDPSEANFIQITRQMFLAHIMKYTLLSSFQKRIKRFGSIVMHITACKLFRAVVYPRVGRIVFSDLLINPILIGHQFLRKIRLAWVFISSRISSTASAGVKGAPADDPDMEHPLSKHMRRLRNVRMKAAQKTPPLPRRPEPSRKSKKSGT